MIIRTELDAYLQDLLLCAKFSDYAPNGLQIEGKPQIARICTAVTASDEVISQAIQFKADALLVHHGYFWRGEPGIITGMKRQRIAKLLNSDINLFAYHLPLDCHLELGNNACIAQVLQLNSVSSHKAGGTENLLWSGSLPTSLKAEDFAVVLEKAFARTPQHIASHNRPITRIAWCSGAAQDYIVDASELGVDAFISGEISERTYYQAKELAIDYFACGHHATERLGIQALGEHLAKKYQLVHQFLDSNNPV